jgi:hypothetical protein
MRVAMLGMNYRPEETGIAGRAYARTHWDRARILPAMEARLSEVTGGGRERDVHWVPRRPGRAA